MTLEHLRGMGYDGYMGRTSRGSGGEGSELDEGLTSQSDSRMRELRKGSVYSKNSPNRAL